MKRPVFSGHESFHCKTHWLKRGYDFVMDGNNFNDEDAVVKLGVGKNMVSSIRYWMKAFALLNNDGQLTPLAHYLLDNDLGRDPFFEDINTLWLMHFSIVNTDYASIYHSMFSDFHRQTNNFDKQKLYHHIKRQCFEAGYQNLFNENTVKKDINVLVQNYSEPRNSNTEDYSALLLPLRLIRIVDREEFCFNNNLQNKVSMDILLYAICACKDSDSVSFEALQEVALIFNLTTADLLELIQQICRQYNDLIVFSDVAGIKELQFKSNIALESILDHYYMRIQ